MMCSIRGSLLLEFYTHKMCATRLQLTCRIRGSLSLECNTMYVCDEATNLQFTEWNDDRLLLFEYNIIRADNNIITIIKIYRSFRFIINRDARN